MQYSHACLYTDTVLACVFFTDTVLVCLSINRYSIAMSVYIQIQYWYVCLYTDTVMVYLSIYSITLSVYIICNIEITPVSL